MPLHPVVENAVKAGEAMVPGISLRVWATANPAKLTDFHTRAALNSANAAKVQAVLLGYLAYGGRTADIVSPFREIIKDWQETDLRGELAEYFALSRTPATGVILMPSFRHANQMEKTSANQTLVRARQGAMKAFLAASAAQRNAGAERTKWVSWFGAFDDARSRTVADNFKRLSDVLGTKPIRAYYRGSHIKGPSDKPNEPGKAPTTEAFASAFRLAVLPAGYDRNFSHITLGKLFFAHKAKTAGVAPGIQARVAMFGGAVGNLSRPGDPYASDRGADSLAGVLVHELSHHVCNTVDAVLPVGSPNPGGKCYGKNCCAWLAQHRPADAITNADSYEYYFEEYQV